MTLRPIILHVASLRRRWGQAQRAEGLAVSTVERRDWILKLFERWCHDHSRQWHELTPDDIRTMLATRGDLAPRTRYAYLSTLSVFYDWLCEIGEAAENPVRHVRRPRLPRLIPRPVSDRDLTHILTQAEALEVPWWLEGRARIHPARVVVVLAAFAGLRCREIAGLDREDLLDGDPDPMIIVAHGKGGHQRVVPMHQEIQRICPLLPRSGPLLTTRKRTLPTSKRVSEWGSAFMKSCGVDATMHQLRHWFGSATYSSCRDLRVVQELLGHQSPTITAGYARWSPETGRQAVSDIDPHPPAA